MPRKNSACFLLNSILKLNKNKICLPQSFKIQTTGITPLHIKNYACCPSFGFATKIDTNEIKNVKVPKVPSKKSKKKDSQVELAGQIDESNILPIILVYIYGRK